MEFLTEADSLLKSFWYIALPVSLIFVIQSVMTFVGTDAFDGSSADLDGNFDHADVPFQLFSFRNLINFLLGFSWTGIGFYETISNKIVLVVLALLVGLFFIYIFFIIIKQLMKLSEDNSFKSENAIGKIAEVYLTIPANNSGTGKISVQVNGSNHELLAKTYAEEAIPSSQIVTIVHVENNIATVEKK